MNFYVCIFLIFVLSLIPSSFAVSDSVHVSDVYCPEQTILGERNNIAFRINNNHATDLLVRDIQLVTDDLDSSNFSQSYVFEPFILNPQTGYDVENNIQFSTVGIHYVDIKVVFNDVENNSEFTLIKDICKVETYPFEKETDPLVLTIFISIIVSGFGSALAYFIKRHFLRKDTEHAKSIDQQHWRLEQIHKLASKYYFPLAKDAWEVERTLALANQSGTNRDMEISFKKLNEFLKRYVDFRNETGATFLFPDQEFEQSSINKTQSVLVSLPYDDKDIDTIVTRINSTTPTTALLTEFNVVLRSFNRWIISTHCRKSLNLLLLRLREFGSILDKQAEKISHPNFVGDCNENHPKASDFSPFWILYSSSKYVRNDDIISVYGEGFNNENITYSFFLEGYELEPITIKNNFIELRIPSDIPPGTYDLSACYLNNNKIGSTIGIVIHIIK